ncbi:hypothetical protein EDD86DRAFT_199806 [Gorgonomyces haynaldii]|nr:hypothetical protein EDD86DRAFT_199806 [Gorgonomyces haynaldii]
MSLVGSRIVIDGFPATVRYVGTLKGKSGEFMGLEWDDPTRGKHSGVYQGESYFTTTVEGSGSFVPSGRSFSTGKGLLDQLKRKYINTESDTTIQWGNVKVESKGWEKISKRVEQLDTLVEIGLSGQEISHRGCPEGELQRTLPLCEDIDLSRNLFENWQQVAEICAEMPKLRILRLSYNRLNMSQITPPNAFASVRILTLAHCGINWNTLCSSVRLMPHLNELFAGFNQISELSSFDAQDWHNIETLNLEHNQIKDFSLLGSLTSLSSLILAGNPLESIPKPNGFQGLKFINLNETKISEWTQVHLLNDFASLVEIRLSHVPVMQQVTERISTLSGRLRKATKINGSQITPKLRKDAEIWYLNQCALVQEQPDFAQKHPNYSYLCEIYGTPVAAKPITFKDTMIAIKLSNGVQTIEKRISPKLTVRALKQIAARVLYPQKWQQAVNSDLTWTQKNIELVLDDPMKPIESFGVAEGDVLLLGSRM